MSGAPDIIRYNNDKMTIGVNMEFTKLTSDDIIGTSLQGYSIEISRAELEEIFGEPTFEGSGDKTTTEWDIMFHDDENTVAAIYDWKRDCAPDYSEEIEWNIGGSNFMADVLVNDMIREHRARVTA